MAAAGSVFSETLQEITTAKLEELCKKRDSFEAKKSQLLESLKSAPDFLAHVKLLSSGVKECMSIKTDDSGRVIRGQTTHPRLEIELKNLDSFLAQADYDQSISSTILTSWEESLMRHLDVQSLKLQYADLYAQLVTEWLSTIKTAGPAADEDTDMAQSGIFEEVDSAARLDARMQWERNVFEPAPVDEAMLNDFLKHLFGGAGPDRRAIAKALKGLQEDIASFELNMSVPDQFSPSSLSWVIKGLLSSDLLTDEKRQALRDFAANEIILTEVADLLNMRMSALGSWSWGPGVVVEQQRKISGIYNIRMHEDLLQAIFLYYIGVKWSTFLKKALQKFRRAEGAWKSNAADIPKEEEKKLLHYIGWRDRRTSVQSTRRSWHRRRYFLAQLLDFENQGTVMQEGEEEADFSKNVAPSAQVRNQIQQQVVQQQQQQQQMAMMQMSQQATALVDSMQSRRMYQPAMSGPMPSYARKRAKMSKQRPGAWQVAGEDESDDDGLNAHEPKRPMEDKQRLLHLLSAEIAINTRIHGELTAFHSVFDSWNSLLPHATILTALSFMGVSKLWRGFFTKFLQAPLRFMDDETTGTSRIRRRGTPASHALSDFFGETVFFLLDYSVNQSTSGGLLYRMYDDIWFWSPDPEVAVTAWKSVLKFMEVTGTSINPVKTGAVRISGVPEVALSLHEDLPKGPIRWGFLHLSPETGRFEIDQKMVDDHISELRKQLQDKQKSVFSFIHAWNTYVSAFFSANFGKPANCFGRSHVDEILATHRRIQREIFSSPAFSVGDSTPTSVVDYLKETLTQRFGVTDIPDAYLFFPVELGGLHLQNPFISILPVRNGVLEDPASLLDEFQTDEQDAYNAAKLAYERGEVAAMRLTNPNIVGDTKWKPTGNVAFPTFEEFIKYREEFDYGFPNQLSSVYKKLLEIPREASLDDDNGRIVNALQGLDGQRQLKGITADWDDMTPYWKWVVSLYGPEVLDLFDGLNLVDPGLLPMGMVSLFRDKRVQWQG